MFLILGTFFLSLIILKFKFRIKAKWDDDDDERTSYARVFILNSMKKRPE